MKTKSIIILSLTFLLHFSSFLHTAESPVLPSIDLNFKEFLKPILLKNSTEAIAAIKNPANKAFINQPFSLSVSGDTPLLIACKNSTIAIIQALLEQGADARIKNKKGVSPISFAYDIGPLTHEYKPQAFDLLKLLINHKYPAEKAYWKNLDGLKIAIENDDPLAVSNFINSVDDPNQIVISIPELPENTPIYSLLGYAIYHTALKVIAMLVNNDKINTNLIQNEGSIHITCTAQFIDVMTKQKLQNDALFLKIIEILIKKTDTINEICSISPHASAIKTTLLGKAITMKMINIINLCLNHPAINVNYAAYSKLSFLWLSPLDLTITKSYKNIKSYLSKQSNQPEELAEFNASNLKIFTLLLNTPTPIPLDIDLNNSLSNLLITIIDANELNFLEALITRHPTTINHICQLEISTYNFEAFLNHFPNKSSIFIPLLAQLDQLIESSSLKFPLTPLIFAIFKKHIAIVQFLLDHNADLMLPNANVNAIVFVDELLKKNPKDFALQIIKDIIQKKLLENYQETIDAEESIRSSIIQTEQEEQKIIAKERALLKQLQEAGNALEQTIYTEDLFRNKLERQQNVVREILKDTATKQFNKNKHKNEAKSFHPIPIPKKQTTPEKKPKSPTSPLMLLQSNKGVPLDPAEFIKVQNFLNETINQARSKIPVKIQALNSLLGMNNVVIDWDHIFNINYKIDDITKKITFVGGHYGPSIRQFFQTKLSKSNAIEKINEASGIVEFKWQSNIDDVPFTKTAFPNDWNMEQIAHAIINSKELLKNINDENLIIYATTTTNPAITLKCIFFTDFKKITYLKTVIPLAPDNPEYLNLMQTLNAQNQPIRIRPGSTPSLRFDTPKSSDSSTSIDQYPQKNPVPLHHISSKASISSDVDLSPPVRLQNLHHPRPATIQQAPIPASIGSNVAVAAELGKEPKSAKN